MRSESDFKATPDAGFGEGNPISEQGGTAMERITDDQLEEIFSSVENIGEYTEDLARYLDDLCNMVMEATDQAVARGADISAAAKIDARLTEIRRKAAEAVMEVNLHLADIEDVVDELDDRGGQEDDPELDVDSVVLDAVRILKDLGLDVALSKDTDDGEGSVEDAPDRDVGRDYLWDVRIPRECPQKQEGMADSEYTANVLEFLTGTVADLMQTTIELAMACAKANRGIDCQRESGDGSVRIE